MTKSISQYLLALLPLLCVSCNDFLDEMPDNRAEVDSQQKVIKLLTSAYPDNDFMLVTEFMSDNVDDFGDGNPYHDRFVDQLYHWEDVTEADNESPERIWESCYKAIGTANEALSAIDKIEADGGESTALSQARGEALLCRAYGHFVLVNVFCQNYNDSTSAADLGIPYLTAPETGLDVHYDRGTVAQVYENIDADLQEGLPLVGDLNYSVPKYHFNERAAYAFAARFYLFWQKWDKAEEYASKCLGSAPKSMLRDWKGMSEMTQEYSAIVGQFIKSDQNCNLLLMTAYSKMGLAFGPYYLYTRYSPGYYLARTEGAEATNLWGSGSSLYMRMKVYSGTNLDRTIFWKLPYLFEYTDAVAGIGYYRTVYPAMWCDETLLVRAEARILQGKYDDAASDLTLWMQNMVNTSTTLTVQRIRRFYNSIEYGTWDAPTLKKRLDPSFDIGRERGDKEAMLQCLLTFRRIETLQQGLRWFDVKRYGVTIYRRLMNSKGEPQSVTDSLVAGDRRWAVQIPLKVRQAGMEANPR